MAVWLLDVHILTRLAGEDRGDRVPVVRCADGRGGEVLATGEGDSHEAPHVQNFIDCIKSRRKPYCDLETIGHPASVLCHAGNIAARVGRTLTLDPQTETFVDDAEANALRTRPEYRKPWVLPAV